MAIDANQIDRNLYRLADYPMLSALAGEPTLATRLDGRACRYLYSTALETIDLPILSAHEIALMRVLGIDVKSI